MSLETLARQVLEAEGMLRVIRVELLRRELRLIGDEEFERQINAITDVELFRMLWYAGLPWNRQMMVLKRIRALTPEAAPPEAL